MVELTEISDAETLKEAAIAQSERGTAMRAVNDIIRSFEDGTYKVEHVNWIPQDGEFSALRVSITLALELKLKEDKRQAQQWSNVRNRVEGLTTGALKKLNTAFSSKGQ